MSKASRLLLIAAGLARLPPALLAEDGHEGWLRYAPVSRPELYRSLPTCIIGAGNSPMEDTAARELQSGLSRMLGRNFALEPNPAELPRNPGTISLEVTSPETNPPSAEGFVIRSVIQNGHTQLTIVGASPEGLL